MSQKKRKFLLVTPSDSEYLNIIRDFIGKIAQNVGFDAEHINKIQLSVDEACTNVVKHAYSRNNKQDIRIQVVTDPNKLTVSVIDKGKGFDPSRIKPQDMNNYLNEYQRGGLGIHLMNILMDKVKFSILPQKRNKVTMIKYLKSNESPEKKQRQKILMEKSYARAK